MNFYFEAARTLDRLDAREGSVKSIIATLPTNSRKRTAALIIETLKFKPVLSEVIAKSSLMKERKLTSLNLALVLVHDFLLTKGIQAGDGPIKQAILRHKTRLHGEFQKIKIKRGVSSNDQLAHNGDERSAEIPRYVRVNTCLGNLEDAVKTFTSLGFSLGDPFSSKQHFSIDEHVSNLLLFHPDSCFQDNPLYISGKIILQDKASCFPAVILSPPASDAAVVIDATAAPGNKTSHLSALMENKGKIFAFERDRKRYSTLMVMLNKAGCVNVTPINGDFLTTDPLDLQYAAVTHILLDPSCSGSGMVNRLDYLLKTEKGDNTHENRLEKLASFQQKILKHAMRFPNVQKIVYSTCSIHAIENEGVVKHVLTSEECELGKFRLAPQNEVLPFWSRRGLPEELDSLDDAGSLVRCLPNEDATNGFFVSCFVKDGKRKFVDNDSPQPHHKKHRSTRHETNQ